MDDELNWCRFFQLVQSLLPTPSRAHTLEALASGWRELTAPTSVLVVDFPTDGSSSVGALATVDQPNTWSIDPLCSFARTKSDDELIKLLRSRAGLRVPTDWPLTSVSLVFEDVAVGRVLLSAPEQPATQRPLEAQLTEISARAIVNAWPKQLQARESAARAAAFQTAKLQSLAEFAAGAGHEIHNPVATISGRAEMLLSQETDPNRRHALSVIRGQAYRIRDMIGDLMLFGNPPQPQLKPENLAEIVEAAAEKLREVFEARGCRLNLQLEDPTPVVGDRTQLLVAVSSLLHNSLDALEDGGTISIETRPVLEAGRPAALLVVGDHGKGLTDVEQEHLFDPFFSGRQAGRGLGFGLTKCWRIVTLHRGRISVDSNAKVGTRFSIHLPTTD